MEDKKYDYLVELIQAVFGAKSIGISAKAENTLHDKGKLCDKNRFNADSEKKFKKVFEVAFTEESKFIHNYKISDYEHEETISQFKIADGINTFILQKHGIDIKETYSSGRNINSDLVFVKFIKELIFDLICAVFRVSNVNKIRSEIGFWIFSYIFKTTSVIDGMVRFYGDYTEINKYIVRYDFKRNLLLIYDKINIDWESSQAVKTVYDAMCKIDLVNDTIINKIDFDLSDKIGKVNSLELNNGVDKEIEKRIEIYNTPQKTTEILSEMFYLYSYIRPFEYNGRNFLLINDLAHTEKRKDFLKNIFASLFSVSGISLCKNSSLQITDLESDEYFLVENYDAFKNCKFYSKNADKFIDIINFVFSKEKIYIYKKNTAINKDIPDTYIIGRTLNKTPLLNRLSKFFEKLGFKILSDSSENIMLSVLWSVVFPELFNVTELTSESDKENIDTASLFKAIADYLINEFKISPFLSDEYSFRYKYYSIYRYVKDDKLFYNAAEEVEKACKIKRNNILDVMDYKKIEKTVFRVTLYRNELDKIYQKICRSAFKWDMISPMVMRLKKIFFEEYNDGEIEDYDMSLILLKIILLCENFAPSDVNEYVEVENYGLPDDRLIEAVHKYADKFKEDNE